MRGNAFLWQGNRDHSWQIAVLLFLSPLSCKVDKESYAKSADTPRSIAYLLSGLLGDQHFYGENIQNIGHVQGALVAELTPLFPGPRNDRAPVPPAEGLR